MSSRRVIKDLKGFFDSLFGKNYFTIIYGSCAYGVNVSNSDLDFMTVCNSFNKRQLDRTLDFISILYKKYNFASDDEIPHKNKVLCSYKMLDDAINGKGFEIRGSQLYIPPVAKNQRFLNSKEMAMRLFLNAITSKNIFVSGDRNFYLQKRERALQNMIYFLFLTKTTRFFKIEEFIQSLIGTPERNGEMYLGYKDDPVVHRYLTKTFRREFNLLRKNGILKLSGERYCMRDSSWLNELSYLDG